VQNLYEILFLLLSYRLSKYAPSQKKRLSYDFATKPLRYSTIRRSFALGLSHDIPLTFSGRDCFVGQGLAPAVTE
jgi:hypothetical protein